MTKTPGNLAGAHPPARLQQDFALGLVIMFIGALLLLWVIPAQVNDAGSFGLPPSLAPRSLTWVMILCGAVLTVQNLRPTSGAGSLRAGDVVFLVACLTAVGVMLLLMRALGDLFDRPNMGFLISAPLGLIAFTFLHSKAPIWAFAFNAIVAPALILAAFWWGLELPLP